MSVNSLPKTVTRQRRDCDLNPGPSAPESSTLTTLLSIVDNNTHYLHRPTRPDETILSRRVGSPAHALQLYPFCAPNSQYITQKHNRTNQLHLMTVKE